MNDSRETIGSEGTACWLADGRRWWQGRNKEGNKLITNLFNCRDEVDLASRKLGAVAEMVIVVPWAGIARGMDILEEKEIVITM